MSEHFLLEFCGKFGRARHGFFSNWHCGPEKLTGQLHWFGAVQIPLFMHAGKQIAKNNLFKINLEDCKSAYVHMKVQCRIGLHQQPIFGLRI